MKGSIVGLSILVLAIGAFLCFYPVEYGYRIGEVTLYAWVEYPYRDYGFILSLVGIAVLVVGLAIPKKVGRSVPPLTTPPY